MALSIDLPKTLRLQIDNFLMDFSTPLILDGELAGSGTFIKCGKLRGILTAHHVVHNPKDSKRRFDFSGGRNQQLALAVVDKRSHSFVVPVAALNCVDVGEPSEEGNESYGPDISVIILPERVAADIEVRKLFLNVSIHRSKRTSDCQSPDGLVCTAL